MSVTSEEASEVLSTSTIPSTASSKTIFYVSSVLILPVLYAFFYILHVVAGASIGSWLKWDTLLVLATIIVMERIYTYRYAVSQKTVLARDIIATFVTLYIVRSRR